MLDTFKFIIIVILAFILGAAIENISSRNDFLEVDYISHLGIAVVHNKLTGHILCYRYDSNSARGYEEIRCSQHVTKEN